MKLIDYLRIPYLLEAQSSETADGTLFAHVAYPELPGCAAEAPSVVEAIEKVEALRIAEILRRLRAGEPVPPPRAPLRSGDPTWGLERIGLYDDISPLLELEEAQLRAT